MSDPAGVGPFDHRAQVEVLLGSILRLMDYPARLDFKDMSDGALGVAMHFEGELPGITPGKRSYLVDCLQFLLNKAINRPNVPRRWVNLGVNAFPEARSQRAPEPARAPAPVVAEPAKAPPQAAPPAPAAQAKKDPAPKAPERSHREPAARTHREAPEASAVLAEDPHWTKLGHALADKAQTLGRLYAVMMLSNEQRARLIKAVGESKGVSARAEGDGHWRRLTIAPDKVAPLPKKHVMPDWGDEEDE